MNYRIITKKVIKSNIFVYLITNLTSNSKTTLIKICNRITLENKDRNMYLNQKKKKCLHGVFIAVNDDKT